MSPETRRPINALSLRSMRERGVFDHDQPQAAHRRAIGATGTRFTFGDQKRAFNIAFANIDAVENFLIRRRHFIDEADILDPRSAAAASSTRIGSAKAGEL